MRRKNLRRMRETHGDGEKKGKDGQKYDRIGEGEGWRRVWSKCGGGGKLLSSHFGEPTLKLKG